MILTLTNDDSIHNLTENDNFNESNILKNNKNDIITKKDYYNPNINDPRLLNNEINNNTNNYKDILPTSPWYDPSLYKTHVLADLTDLPSLGLRWRTQSEVLSGKGLFTCGNLFCKPYTHKSIPEILKLIQSKKMSRKITMV